MTACSSITHTLINQPTAAETTTPSTTASTTVTTTTTTIPGIENVMTKDQIKTAVENILSADLSNQSPVTDTTRAIWPEAEDVNQSVYYYLTGRTFEEDNFNTVIYTLDEKNIPNFPQVYLNADGTPNVMGTVGGPPYGSTIDIFVLGNPTSSNTDAYNSARTFLMALANETGNAMDTRMTSNGFQRNYTGLIDVQADSTYWEAAKMAYQGAYFHFLEDDIGINLTVTDTAENRETIQEGVDYDRTGTNIAGNAWYLMWTILLENQELKSELDQNGKLSSVSCMKLHDIIVKELQTNSDYAERVKTALADESTEQTIESYIYKNLVPSGAGITDINMYEIYFIFTP
jgi:hypothetical protein